jgi:protein-disulfide isomerase
MIKSLAILAALTFTWAMILVTGARAAVDWEITHTWQTNETPISMTQTEDGHYTFLLTASHQVLIMDADGRQEAMIPVDASVTTIEVSASGDQLFLLEPDRKQLQIISLTYPKEINITGSPFLGMPNAPVTIVVFSDFQCPYCSKLAELLPQVLDLYPERVKIVYKNFPLSIHKFAASAARAAMAAANQGKFWPYHDLLFTNARSLTDNELLTFAKQLGLNLPKFSADLSSVEVSREIARDIRDGQKADVGGTPTVFINGLLLKDRSLAGFQRMIDKELAKTEKADGGHIER